MSSGILTNKSLSLDSLTIRGVPVMGGIEPITTLPTTSLATINPAGSAIYDTPYTFSKDGIYFVSMVFDANITNSGTVLLASLDTTIRQKDEQNGLRLITYPDTIRPNWFTISGYFQCNASGTQQLEIAMTWVNGGTGILQVLSFEGYIQYVGVAN